MFLWLVLAFCKQTAGPEWCLQTSLNSKLLTNPSDGTGHWWIQGVPMMHTLLSTGSFFFLFMQFLGKIGQNNRLVPPFLWLLHSSLDNPGSATAGVSPIPPGWNYPYSSYMINYGSPYPIRWNRDTPYPLLDETVSLPHGWSRGIPTPCLMKQGTPTLAPLDGQGYPLLIRWMNWGHQIACSVVCMEVGPLETWTPGTFFHLLGVKQTTFFPLSENNYLFVCIPLGTK